MSTQEQDFQWTEDLKKEFTDFCLEYPDMTEIGWLVEKFKQQKGEKRSPEYEILSFRDPCSDAQRRIVTCQSHLLTREDWAQSWLKANAPIHSVRRLSDGEVFTLGDSLDRMLDDCPKIDAFLPNHKGNQLWLSTNKEYGYGCALNHATKLPTPKPLFTTEDGVEVHSGENCWIARPQVQGGYKLIRWHEVCESGMQYGERYFSQQKAAQEWIEAQTPKPLFRTEDGVDIYKGTTFYEVSTERWDVLAESEPHKPPYDQYYKYFAKKHNAERYVLLNKPVLSVSDVMDLYQNHSENFETFLSAVNEAAKAKL